MLFEIIEPIRSAETFARGSSIRELSRLVKIYGRGNWRKGEANIRLIDGCVRIVELHWYEAIGIGRKEFKIKRFLD